METTEQIRRQSGEAAHYVKEKSGQAVHQAKETGRNLAARQKEQMIEKLRHCGNASRKAAEQLRQENEIQMADYAEVIADQIERTSDYFRNRNVRDMMDDLGNLARRQPEIFFGGMFLAGLAAARFLRSSSRHTHEITETERREPEVEQIPVQTYPVGGTTAPTAQPTPTGVVQTPTGVVH